MTAARGREEGSDANVEGGAGAFAGEAAFALTVEEEALTGNIGTVLRPLLFASRCSKGACLGITKCERVGDDALAWG